MFSGIRLGRIFGISVELHSSFVILFALLVAFIGLTNASILLPVVVMLFILFFSVLMHELFHSIAAISKGVRVEKIILLPIGGVALTKKNPSKPFDEFFIAIAGPVFNFLVVFAIIFALAVFPSLPFPFELFSGEVTAETANNALLNYPLFALLWVNFMLGAFNLFVPALPLDGGRILRALLSHFVGHTKGTILAAKLSKFLSIVMFGIGFVFGNIFLLVIGVLIFLAAGQEKTQAIIQDTLGSKTIEGAVQEINYILPFEANIMEARNKMNELNQTDMLVDLGTHGIGVISSELLETERNLAKSAREIAQKVPVLSTKFRAFEAMNLFNSGNFNLVPVAEKNKVKGFVSRESIEKLFRLSKLNKNI
jgi:Zn-dependent protease